MRAPNNEPPDGDFVAYLRGIEREQIRALKLHGAAAEALVAAAEIVTPHARGQPGAAAREAESAAAQSLDRGQAAALRARLGDDSGALRAVLVALAAGFVGLVLLVSGLFGNGGWPLAGIGALVLWQAGRSLATAVRTLAGSTPIPPRARP